VASRQGHASTPAPETPSRTAKHDNSFKPELRLPEELLKELREATLALNREVISAIIERIESQAPDTAKALQKLMDDFQMGQIYDLLESIK
jgi:hypothetical protein